MIKKIICILLTIFSVIYNSRAQGLSIRGGHSHNDYSKEKPLTDAISCGLVSVEADIFPVNNQLLVGHSREDLQEENTLEKLYLEPLEQMVKQNVIQNIILLIDIKAEGVKCYELLKPLLNRYASMLTVFTRDSLHLNKITVILSGERPMTMLDEPYRLTALDGRFDNISFNSGFTFFPLISEDWNKYFKWNGKAAITAVEEQRLQEWVAKCHSQHKLIRFWGLPDDKDLVIEFWKIFLKADVDLLGVDSPAIFKYFIQNPN